MKKNCEMRCGSCLHLDCEKAQHLEAPCSRQGKLPTSKSCSSYRPNFKMLTGSEDKDSRLEHLAMAIQGMTPTELQALAGVLLHEKKTRAAGWSFNQLVYVRYRGSATRNYLGNFCMARVMYADKETVRVVGNSGKTCMLLVNEKDGHTLYTAERFRDMRKDMIARKSFVDPFLEGTAPRPPSNSLADFDAVVAAESFDKKRIRPQKSRTDDLVRIVSRISSWGTVRKVKSRKSRSSGKGIDSISFKG